MIPEKFLNKVVCGDCLELMKELPDNSVDLIVTDPPYNWNKGFANDNLKEEEFWDFLSNVIKESFRITKSWICIDIPRTKLVEFQKIICNNFIFYDYFCIAINNSMANCGLGIDRFSLKIIARKNNECKIKNRKSNLFITQRSSTGIYTGHPTQKDLNGYKTTIYILSNENDIILDPFMGSGTTAIACKQLKRNFIGMEISPKYCEIIEKRLKENTQEFW